VRRELSGDIRTAQDRRRERARLLLVQRRERHVLVGEHVTGTRGQRAYARGHFLAPVRHHDRQRAARVPQQVRQELDRLLVGPVQILHHEHHRTERGQHLGQAAEQPVPLGRPVVERLGRRRQHVRQLREQAAQRTGHRRQRRTRQLAARGPQRLDDRPQRERLPDLAAATGQDPPPGGLRPRQQLGDQARLADACLALDDQHRRRHGQRGGQPAQLRVATDQDGGDHPARDLASAHPRRARPSKAYPPVLV